MAAADQKRDRLGRFVDEGKSSAVTDSQLVARSQKKIIRWELQLKQNEERYLVRKRMLEQQIADEVRKMDDILGSD